MGYLGRRIGKSQDTGNSDPASRTDVGGGILDLFAAGYFERQGKSYNAPGISASGLQASGGVVSDYVIGSNVYRAHIFTTSGTFDVDSVGSYGSDVDYLVIGGGGGGGHNQGGGGGAGGYRTSMPEGPGGPNPSAESKIPVAPGSFPAPFSITVGGGGGSVGPGNQFGNAGTPSIFSTITSEGGGAGAHYSTAGGGQGGSGGGAGAHGPTGPSPGGQENRTPGGSPVPNQGYNGGGAAGSSSQHRAGGGGGAGGAGVAGNPGGVAGPGGVGKASVIVFGPTNPENYAGGGGGSVEPTSGPARGNDPNNPHGAGGGPFGGGIGGAGNVPGSNGTFGTGAGGGGGGPGPHYSGSGGSGLVVIRYQIAEITASAKATGGSISFYNDGSGMKTIHTFTSTQTFAVNQEITNAEFVIVAGGGAGGKEHGGGGGAGGVVYHPGITFPSSYSNTVQVGGGGASSSTTPGNDGNWGVGHNGTDSIIYGLNSTNYAAYRGGGGGTWPGVSGVTGGSGGGASGGPGTSTAVGSGTNPNPNPGATNIGNAGAPGSDPQGYAGGGGGGGGAAGSAGTGGVGGKGGLGYQLPSTFRNPASSVGTPGPDAGGFYVAGGGGGCGGPSSGSVGAAPDGGGGGKGNYDPVSAPADCNAKENTGGGGGGGSNNTVSPHKTANGAGGSGIVLIAYPTT